MLCEDGGVLHGRMLCLVFERKNHIPEAMAAWSSRDETL